MIEFPFQKILLSLIIGVLGKRHACEGGGGGGGERELNEWNQRKIIEIS